MVVWHTGSKEAYHNLLCMQGHPNTLQSQFRLTYSMMLNLMRVETLRYVSNSRQCVHVENFPSMKCIDSPLLPSTKVENEYGFVLNIKKVAISSSILGLHC